MAHTRCMDYFEDTESNTHFGKTESRKLVVQWMRSAIAPDLLYVHSWKAGDLGLSVNVAFCYGKLARDDRRIQH
jgi:hypothetical protein